MRREGEYALLNAMNSSFEEIVGVECKVDRDEAVYDPPKGYEQGGIILVADLHAAVRDEIATHSLYYRREVEWKKAYGPFGYE